MNHITGAEMTLGIILLCLAFLFISILIGAGIKIAADSAIEDAERSVNRRAERLAKQIIRERLDGCRIQVTQKISVIEDDLNR